MRTREIRFHLNNACHMSRHAGESTAGVLLGGALFGLAGGALGLLLSKALPSDVPARQSKELTTPSSADSLHDVAVRQLYAGSAALAFSILADSGLEHYRGGFYNKLMYLAPTVSAFTLARSTTSLLRPPKRSNRSNIDTGLFAVATLTGLIGTAFHARNISKREGGWSWLNLFYGAPLAAPMGITFAGLLGLAAQHLSENPGARLVGLPVDSLLSFAASGGLLGTAAEAGLLHFRGAFQDPFMYLPVMLPPAAAVALSVETIHAGGILRKMAQLLLKSTAALGFIGMGFHAYGIQRNMGGWYNWSQMILQGPPLPAPPSFTGMALAGLAALALKESDNS